MAAPSVFFGTSWEDEVAQAPVAPAVTPEPPTLPEVASGRELREESFPPQSLVRNAAASPKQRQKSFQYAGYFQPGHDYSPFHKQLDASLKHLYSRTNLAAVVLEKGWLLESELHRLDSAIMDIWALVVWVKIPAQIPYKKTICRFVSKKDFLRVVIESAQQRSKGMTTCKHRTDLTKILIESTSGKYYKLTPQHKQCECSCPAYESLSAAFGEDARMGGLLKAHPVLKGQVPDKHVFGLWSAWKVKNFKAYQSEQQNWERRQQTTQQYKDTLQTYGIALRQTIPGHFDMLNGPPTRLEATSRRVLREEFFPPQTRIRNAAASPKILGSVDRRYDAQDNSWWVNQRRISSKLSLPGDHVHYGTAEEAALALAKLCKVIDDGEFAKADLFGGGWDAQPEHLIESHTDFIDDINQEMRAQRGKPALLASQPVAVASPKKKVVRDPFGGFNF